MTLKDFEDAVPDPKTLSDGDVAWLSDKWDEFEEGFPKLAGELTKRYGKHVAKALKARGAKKAQAK